MRINRIPILLIGLLAVLALSAVASASSASAECLKVVEAGKGEFEEPTCVGAAGTKAYIKAKLVAQIKPGEWCAKVEVLGKGNKDHTCVTNSGATKNEYIKVKAVAWQVCEKTTESPITEPPEKFDEHKCNTKVKALAEREWEWKYLEAGKAYNVVSEGGEEKLILNTSPQIIITCKKVKDKGNIKGGVPGTDEVTELEYTECSINISGCTVVKTAGAPNGTIVVPPPLKTKLLEEGAGINDEFTPSSPPLFVTLEIETSGKAKCGVLPFKNEVTGVVVGKLEAPTGGNLGEKINFTNPAQKGSTLKVSGIEAILESTIEQKLENGWAFRAS